MASEEVTGQVKAAYRTSEAPTTANAPRRVFAYGAIHRAQYQHEEITQQAQNDHDERMADKEYAHRKEMLKKELGCLGRLFGSDKHSARTIAFVIVIALLLVSTGIMTYMYFFTPADQDTKRFELVWSNTVPVITLTLGYLFGSGTGKNDK